MVLGWVGRSNEKVACWVALEVERQGVERQPVWQRGESESRRVAERERRQ